MSPPHERLWGNSVAMPADTDRGTFKPNRLVIRRESARLPTIYGEFQATVYCDQHGVEHVALIMGEPHAAENPLVRIHSECLTGDALGSVRCDCRDQLSTALARIAEEGCGVVVYLRQEGRGIGLANKIRAYSLQDAGLDTVEANLHLGFPADARSYAMAAAMLRDLGICRVRLLTNNPRKIADLEGGHIHVVERVVQPIPARPENEYYLQTKARKLGHLLGDMVGIGASEARVDTDGEKKTRMTDARRTERHCDTIATTVFRVSGG